MTSLAAEYDPYILAMPGPDSPVVLSQWISPGNTHHNARYWESVWPLAPLIGNPSTSLFSIFWRKCPVPLLARVEDPQRLGQFGSPLGVRGPCRRDDCGPRARCCVAGEHPAADNDSSSR
ncbi:hypothetical protein ACFV27_38990 [Streptomyces antimycoticus]|uniref:hypothetical protein n=1 Tax=Streptomyces antimycoticus TaxID=68175 RepID=UPI00368F189A